MDNGTKEIRKLKVKHWRSNFFLIGIYKKDNRSKVWHGISKATLKKMEVEFLWIESYILWNLRLWEWRQDAKSSLEQKSDIFSHLTAQQQRWNSSPFLFTLASFLFTLASFPFLESTVLAFVIPLCVMPSPQILPWLSSSVESGIYPIIVKRG